MQQDLQEAFQVGPAESEAASVEEMSVEVREDCPHVSAPRHGVTVGTVVGWNDAGQVLVDYPGNPASGSLPALSTVVISVEALGSNVGLMFVNGDPFRPILLGLIDVPPEISTSPKARRAEAVVDGKKMVFTAEEEIVFQCGKASIILTKAGKILLRGEYLLSRSSGVNRIKGAAVQIN